MTRTATCAEPTRAVQRLMHNRVPFRGWRPRAKQERERHPCADPDADGGCSTGSRVRLWKLRLQTLADELGLTINVRHLPPGTRKWNKIEHRLFSFITQTWRGRPLISLQLLVELIAATRTRAGLTVRSEINPKLYPAGAKVTDQEMANLKLQRHDFHGQWNYTIAPRTNP